MTNTAKEKKLIAIAAEAEQRCIRAEQLLTSFLGNMPALSFIKDDEGRYLYASKSFAEFFKKAPEEFLGKTDTEWLPPDVAQQFIDNDNHVRTTGKAFDVIERVPVNGVMIESIVQKFPMMISERPYIGGIAIDITERKRADDRIRELAADLESLAYVLSHELQEPVNTIKSYQNLLAVRYKGRLGTDADSFIDVCSEAAVTIEKMVSSLWVFARIEKEASFKVFDSTRALGTALIELADAIAAKNASVKYGTLPPVRGSERQITDVFVQLIRNALQYSDEGVEIKISTRNLGLVEEFCVEDNGHGIDSVAVKDAFRLFKRTGLQRPDGTSAGMGLPICQRIIEHHGGTMGVESQRGVGSKFLFSLPAVETGSD